MAGFSFMSRLFSATFNGWHAPRGNYRNRLATIASGPWICKSNWSVARTGKQLTHSSNCHGHSQGQWSFKAWCLPARTKDAARPLLLSQNIYNCLPSYRCDIEPLQMHSLSSRVAAIGGTALRQCGNVARWHSAPEPAAQLNCILCATGTETENGNGNGNGNGYGYDHGNWDLLLCVNLGW